MGGHPDLPHGSLGTDDEPRRRIFEFHGESSVIHVRFEAQIVSRPSQGPVERFQGGIAIRFKLLFVQHPSFQFQRSKMVASLSSKSHLLGL